VLIGVGAAVLGMHRPALGLETVELVGVMDVNRELGLERAEELGCPFYDDYREMLAEARPEVAVVMTPHPFHAPIAIDCLRAGCHVLVEKPLAVEVAEADAMIEAAERAGRLLAVNFQSRHRPDVRAAKRLIGEGRLGRIQRLDLTATWTRPAAYYRSAAWRGTWAGEGGGILMNQAPHHLDVICHLMGPPARVVAWTRTLLHQIETEDTAQAMLEWPDGTLGSVHVSTAQAGQPERLEISGTAGQLTISRGELTFRGFEPELHEHVATSLDFFKAPADRELAVEREPGAGDHLAVYRNLHAAILEGAPLAADGAEGRMSLELANAMIYSSYTGSQVELPLDRREYAALLEELRARRA
jgi:predicted dehydrogenase